jgi:predicted component of type VI protein secretion system
MIQLRILSGKLAGENVFVRRFPFRIGRAPQNDLALHDAGVWDEHLKIGFQKREGFILETSAEAFAAINEKPQKSSRLRNGDIISFGSAKIQFWLAPARQRNLAAAEIFVWLLLGAVTAIQVFLLLELRK